MEKPLPEPDRVESGPAGRFLVLAALVLTLTLPGDGHSQANRERERLRQTHRDAPSWLECFAPHECEVRVFTSGLHGRKGRFRILAARAASACRAAGYSHYVAGTPKIGGVAGLHFIQRVYFTHDSEPPARPCSFSATAELEAEAKEMARVNGYPWPVGQVPEEAGRWTFEPGENDWGEALPLLDKISAPIVHALRSHQEDLAGLFLLTGDCAATLAVLQLDAGLGDFWAYVEGGSDVSDVPDRILEVRVDGTSVKKQGQNVTKPTAGMVASSKQTFGVAVRSAEHEDNAAFEWTVTDSDRATIRERFPHCVGSR